MKVLIKIWKAIDGILLIVVLLSGCWTGAYFAMDWFVERFDWQPQALPRQLTVSFLGFVFLWLFISMLTPFVRKRQHAFFQELSDTLRKISRGDFSATVKANPGRMGMLAAEINDMAGNLKAMEEMRQEFISNVSHEIQSPLTSISGFARAMLADELPRELQLQYLEIITAESARLSTLSSNLLRLASLDSEQHPFSPEAYRLDKQLQQHILMFEPQWLNKELDMLVQLEPLTIKADQSLLSQVWVNLLSNAIKFTPRGGTVSISLRLEEDHAAVCVADTGCGISKEDQAHIFERFFKADKSRTRMVEGSGLGLSIVSKIVEMHQGSIQVVSEVDEGTKFTVTLPR